MGRSLIEQFEHIGGVGLEVLLLGRRAESPYPRRQGISSVKRSPSGSCISHPTSGAAAPWKSSSRGPEPISRTCSIGHILAPRPRGET